MVTAEMFLFKPHTSLRVQSLSFTFFLCSILPSLAVGRIEFRYILVVPLFCLSYFGMLRLLENEATCLTSSKVIIPVGSQPFLHPPLPTLIRLYKHEFSCSGHLGLIQSPLNLSVFVFLAVVWCGKLFVVNISLS